MKISDAMSSANRLQKTTLFKIVASVVVVLLGVAAFVTYTVQVARAAQTQGVTRVEPDAGVLASFDKIGQTNPQAGPEVEKQQKEVAAALKAQYETVIRSINSIIDRRLDTGTFAVGTAVACAVLLVVVWLGLALTYLAAAFIAAAVALPMMFLGNSTFRSIAWLIVGAISLAAMFSALIELLRVCLAGSNPVTSIASNVVSEAIRMKISLIFVVMLVFGLSALPQLMDPEKALRYRVQSFLTWGIGGSYWLIAILAVFLSCATVAFEQRDRVIWQTMTKPVRSWQYVLGKWLGVVGIVAVLLTVACSGCLMFTEWLRRQPAHGESSAFVSADPQEPVTQDRMILETQVLTAKSTVRPTLPEMPVEIYKQQLETRLAKAKQDSGDLFVDTPDARGKIIAEMNKEYIAEFLRIEPGVTRTFPFEGLTEAVRRNMPVTLRYKVHAGSDLPTDLYRMTFQPFGAAPFVREVRLGTVLTEVLSPTAIQMLEDPIGSGTLDGKLVLMIANGDIERRTLNKETTSMAPDSFEIAYPVGGFLPNFFRVGVVMWLKIAFLAMVGVVAGTFLSFAVASLTSCGVFLCAEGASFLTESLESFEIMDADGTFMWWRLPIKFVGEGVSAVFGTYSRLDPTERLVEGKYFAWGEPAIGTLNLGFIRVPFPVIEPWDSMIGSLMVFGIVLLILWGIGTRIFRSRELAIYSGQ